MGRIDRPGMKQTGNHGPERQADMRFSAVFGADPVDPHEARVPKDRRRVHDFELPKA